MDTDRGARRALLTTVLVFESDPNRAVDELEHQIDRMHRWDRAFAFLFGIGCGICAGIVLGPLLGGS